MIAERGHLSEVYNLGTHFELTIRELAERIHAEVTQQAQHEIAPFRVEYSKSFV